jgi:hypothetical protein
VDRLSQVAMFALDPYDYVAQQHQNVGTDLELEFGN